MNLYRQSILLFGLILPLSLAGALLAAGIILKTKVESSYQQNVTGFKESETNRLMSLAVEGKLLPQRPAMERWTKSLSGETASIVTAQLNEILSGIDPKELQLTSNTTTATKAGFGTVSAQKSSQLEMEFRGTYLAMQRALLEFETRLPQLHCQDLKIDQSTTHSGLLTFKINFTAWEI